MTSADVLQMCFVQLIVACSSQSHPSNGLGVCAFNPCLCGILLPKRLRLLFLSACLKCLMSRLRTQMQNATRRLGLGTRAAHRTISTDLRGKHDFYPLLCHTPASTRLALWAGGLLIVPIELEMGQVKPLACFGLPLLSAKTGPTNLIPCFCWRLSSSSAST